MCAKHRIDREIGLGYGFLGVLGFSLTLPATRVAVVELDPIIVGLGRAIIAAFLAAIVLWANHQRIPARKHWRGLIIVAAGVVLGFPLLSAWAMQQLPAAHGAVVLALMPLATAFAGSIIVGERPSRRFWLASITGSITVIIFAILSGAGQMQWADVVLLGAGMAAAISYAEGGRLARILGGWQVICWALVIAAPVLSVPFAKAVLQHGLVASPTAWLGFGYLSIISQFLAFFPWYQGLAIGGVARVGQMQLLQPFLTILASAILLGEAIAPFTLIAAMIVVTSVAIGRTSAIQRN
ncbi:DMT family transporter [Gloeocapsopsis sp. IPPAS B-1203]|uniref:DMT family transporter n=1 Tax=Gloeocapsopsis sp. IPPAS B-1203 TaxID=2049454 RepID=UPI000C19CB7C|nr:DMT family transporter [Gloeocapsopsis sp. IPPAS B-1203]PIG95409.1 EamA family transporter [Gloeocapsopsis sp. IPPAS B-1203]